MGEVLPKAILLDLDDTILSFSDSADPCWRRVCGRFARRVVGLTPEKLFDAIRESRDWFWGDAQRHQRGRLDLRAARREIVAKAFDRLGVEAPDLANRIADAYTAEREEGVALFPGAVEALRTFRERGVRLGLITNGEAALQRRKVERFGLAPYFDYMLIEGEFGVGKPDERVYRHALQQLDASPEDTWMVGDNLEWDVGAPQRLGIFGIWLDFAGSGLPEGSPVQPDRIIRALSELVEG
jgi:putative hydrolase of the HAD superfamily